MLAYNSPTLGDWPPGSFDFARSTVEDENPSREECKQPPIITASYPDAGASVTMDTTPNAPDSSGTISVREEDLAADKGHDSPMAVEGDESEADKIPSDQESYDASDEENDGRISTSINEAADQADTEHAPDGTRHNTGNVSLNPSGLSQSTLNVEHADHIEQDKAEVSTSCIDTTSETSRASIRHQHKAIATELWNRILKVQDRCRRSMCSTEVDNCWDLFWKAQRLLGFAYSLGTLVEESDKVNGIIVQSIRDLSAAVMALEEMARQRKLVA